MYLKMAESAGYDGLDSYYSSLAKNKEMRSERSMGTFPSC